MRFAAGPALLLKVCWLACLLMAQEPVAPPAIRPHGVVNAASRMPPDVRGGAIARGSLFSIFGVRLGPAAPPPAGVSVLVESSGRTLEAAPVFVSPERIDAVMPAQTPLGQVSLTVTFGGQSSVPYSVTVAESSPGIFTRNALGWGPAIDPVRPGDLVTLEATGLGARKSADFEVWVAGRRVPRPIQVRRARSIGGRDEIRFRIPRDIALGCWVPVQVRTAGGIASNTVTLSIREGGGPCSTSGNWLLRQASAGGKRAAIILLHSKIEVAFGSGALQEFTSDRIDGVFRGLNARSGAPGIFEILPPEGACTSYAQTVRLADLLAAAGPAGAALDAGHHLTLSGPQGDREVGKVSHKVEKYSAHLGGRAIGLREIATPLFFAPGNYVIRGDGGTDVGPFRASVRFPPVPEWTNRQDITAIDRQQGVTLRWNSSQQENEVVILAGSLDPMTGTLGVSVCLANPGSREFFVPPYALSNFPASQPASAIPTNVLGIATLEKHPQPFQAEGIDEGIAGWIALTAKAIPFR